MVDTRDRRWLPSLLVQAGLFLALAGLCALSSNSMAGPSRHLAWLEQFTATLPGPTTTVMPARVQPMIKPMNVPQPAVPSPPPQRNPFAADPAQPIREISPEDAWALYQAKAPFLDARRSAEYTEGHIAGAWSASVWESTVDAQITEFEAAAKPGSSTALVLYCGGGDCEDSHLLASRLATLGYRNLLVYRAGYPDWVQQGRPTGKGLRP